MGKGLSQLGKLKKAFQPLFDDKFGKVVLSFQFQNMQISERKSVCKCEQADSEVTPSGITMKAPVELAL